MLKIRVIPTLLWKDLGLVKGESFDSWRRVGTVLPAVKVYNTRQVDELIVLDITATQAGRSPDYAGVEEFSKECFVPLTIGGGIRDLEHIKLLLRSGADKIVINSAAYDDPDLINKASEKFGAQCIVTSIDARKVGSQYICYSHCGTKNRAIEVGAWASEVAGRGAGEIVITSIENDGTMRGYDIELIRQVSQKVSIPVIASGGAGNYEHMYRAINEGGASAVAAAAVFHFTQQTPLEAKMYLQSKGVPVRNSNVI